MPAWSDANGAARATDRFLSSYGHEPDGVWAAPGRVNLIGEHVDYNGGLCLPIALPHRTFVALGRREDWRIRLVSALAPADVWTGAVDDVAPGRITGWAAYAAGPVWALRQEGLAIGGFDAAIESCVPVGAGLSSSAAIGCAVAVALDATYELGLAADDPGRTRLAAACVAAENHIAGAPTGGMDQAAALRARAGHALLLDSLDASVAHVPFDLGSAGLELLVVDTRAPHALVDGQYADRRRSCHAAARRLGVDSLREITDLNAALAELTDPRERARVRHVVTEIDRVRRFVALLRAGRVDEVGPLMDESHESLRTDYEVSCAELDLAVRAARRAGALGARMTGGGFGGSAIALIEAGSGGPVGEAIRRAFADAGMREPDLLSALPSAAAGPVETRADMRR